jgi:arsenite methyltransferase
MAEMTEIRDSVRERYAAAARATTTGGQTGCCGSEGAEASCCGGEVALVDESGNHVFGGALYGEAEAGGAPAAAVRASLGCGVPTAVADLHEGETVLDLGSGAGADVLISARRVAPTGKA